MHPIKNLLVFFTYLWLRFDPFIWITFKKDWNPRYDFMKNMFGKKDTQNFLKHRVKLVERRKKSQAPIILPSRVEKEVNLFLKIDPASKTGKLERAKTIERLIFWATDSEINRTNIDSHKTRQVIIDSLLGHMFQNSLASELETILTGLQKIVFSRITYLGIKGEPSPIVHDTIIAGIGRILTSHFNEVIRLRNEQLDKLTKIKMIKEIQKAKKDTGSLAFSGDAVSKNDDFRNKFPLENSQSKKLLKILNHYQFSAWPESRDKAIELKSSMEKQLGFSLEEGL